MSSVKRVNMYIFCAVVLWCFYLSIFGWMKHWNSLYSMYLPTTLTLIHSLLTRQHLYARYLTEVHFAEPTWSGASTLLTSEGTLGFYGALVEDGQFRWKKQIWRCGFVMGSYKWPHLHFKHLHGLHWSSLFLPWGPKVNFLNQGQIKPLSIRNFQRMLFAPSSFSSQNIY